MKKDVFLWLRRCQFPLMLLLSIMPLLLIELCIDAPDALREAGVLFAAFVLVSSLCLLAPGSRRMLAASLGSAAMLAISLVLLPVKAQPLLLLLPTSLIALLFFSLPLAMRQYESEIPPFVYVAGVAIHIIVQFLHHYFKSSNGVSPYEPAASLLTAALIGYILLFLLSMNRISLDNASLARHRLPASMRRFNTVLTLAFMAISLTLAALPAVARAIRTLGRALAGAVARLSAWLLSLLPSVAETGGGSSSGMANLPELAGEAVKPGVLAQLMEKIASILSLVIIAVGSVILLRLLFEQLRRLMRWLSARLKLYMSVASSEYDDEITDTREDGAQRETRFLRRDRRRAGPQANTPNARIRQAYARLIRRHPQWLSSSTARENLPEEAAALYERARYSEHPITTEDAERFASGTKRL